MMLTPRVSFAQMNMARYCYKLVSSRVHEWCESFLSYSVYVIYIYVTSIFGRFSLAVN